MIVFLDGNAREVGMDAIHTASYPGGNVRGLRLAIIELADRANLLRQLTIRNRFRQNSGALFDALLFRGSLRNRNQVHAADRALAGLRLTNLRMHGTGPLGRGGWLRQIVPWPKCESHDEPNQQKGDE